MVLISGSTGGFDAGGTGGFIVVYIGTAVVYTSIVVSMAEMASM